MLFKPEKYPGLSEEEKLLRIIEEPGNKKDGEPLSQEELDELVGEVAREMGESEEEEEKKVEKVQKQVSIPEVFKQNYDKLHIFEKILIFCDDATFKKWLSKYEEASKGKNVEKWLGKKNEISLGGYEKMEKKLAEKIGIIKRIRTLIKEHNPRVALISEERSTIEKIIAGKIEAIKNRNLSQKT